MPVAASLALTTFAFSLPAGSTAWASERTPAARTGVKVAAETLSNDFDYPVWTHQNLGPVWMSSPVVATIDNVKAVVLATLSGEIYVFNARTGKELPGWPRMVHIDSATPTALDSSPAVAYLDGPDKQPSIIVGAGSLWRHHQQGGLEAFWANGKVRFVFKTRRTFDPWGGADNYSDPVFATPAVGDITGTGQLDIVFGSYDHYIYALKPNGQLVPGFPVNRADTIWSSAALADTTHTGRDDIFMGGDSSGLHGCRGGWIVDYRYVASHPKLIWEKCTGQTVWSSPTVGILNGTNRPAVVVGTSYYSPYHSAATDEIFAVYADNGATVPGWPVKARGPTFGSPAIGRLNGHLAVVATSCAQCTSGPAVVTAWTGSGRRLWSTVYDAHNEATSSPVLVDMTGGSDGGNDVLVGAAWGLYVLSGKTGRLLYGTGQAGKMIDVSCDVANSPAVAYVPGAPGNKWMLFVACGGPQRRSKLTAYSLPVAPSASNPSSWPQWRANADHTGVADPTTVPQTRCGASSSKTDGYRLTAGDGKVSDHGNLSYCGDLSTSVLPASVVSMTSTPDKGGYWLLLADGAVYAFGDAKWYGDLRGADWTGGPVPPGAPVVSIAASSDGKGYFVVAATGSVYAFGDADYHGSRGGKSTDGSVVGIAVDPATGGYWLVTSKGAVYAEDAPAWGSLSSRALASPIVAIAPTSSGTGYLLVAKSGTVYSYSLSAHGTVIHKHTASAVIGIVTSSSGTGYWLASANGTVVHVGNVSSNVVSASAHHSEPMVAFS